MIKRVTVPRQSGPRDDRGDHPLNDLKNRQHEIETVRYSGFCQCEADKQFECMFRALQIGCARTGLDHADGKKQYQHPESDGFEGSVNVQHDLPDSAAFEIGRILGEQGPDFFQLRVPGTQR